MHDDISIVPDRISVNNVSPVGNFPVHSMTIARDYKTSYAPSLGVEYHGKGVMLGAGLGYETAAAPRATVSPMTVDANKWLVGFGGGYEASGWQIGGAVGYVAVDDVLVPRVLAGVNQLQPLRSMPLSVPVNAGRYETSYWLAGLRAARRF